MEDRKYFLLKRLHSLTGVIPVAGFVIFHLFENSHSVAGPEEFNKVVGFIRSQPYLAVLELGLLLPIFFHLILGVWIIKAARPNVGSFSNRANWSYLLQRISGVILLFFIISHLINTRFADIPSDHMFQNLAQQFAKPGIMVWYTLGILSAAYHLSNGLWGFAVSWGIVTGQKSMDLAWKACMGLGVAVALMGLNAYAGFEGKGIDWFDHKESVPVRAMAPAPETAPAPVPAAQPKR